MREYDEYEEELLEDDFSNEKEDSLSFIFTLSFLSTWFIRIGMVVAVILFVYYIITGKILMACFYILGLTIAFFFGYVFMFLLDKFISAN